MIAVLLLSLVGQVDLSAFDAPPPPQAAVDLSCFDVVASPSPSPSQSPSIDLTCFDVATKQEAETITVDYPVRQTQWTWPGKTRESLVEHLMADANHRGKNDGETLAMLSFDELKSLHSDQHENKSKPITVVVDKIDRPVLKKMEVPRPKGRVERSGFDGRIRYEHTDGVWRESPQDGIEYGSPPVATAVQQSATCPGGVCPVPQATVRRRGWF